LPLRQIAPDSIAAKHTKAHTMLNVSGTRIGADHSEDCSAKTEQKRNQQLVETGRHAITSESFDSEKTNRSGYYDNGQIGLYCS
jgi:hypothetical protein